MRSPSLTVPGGSRSHKRRDDDSDTCQSSRALLNRPAASIGAQPCAAHQNRASLRFNASTRQMISGRGRLIQHGKIKDQNFAPEKAQKIQPLDLCNNPYLASVKRDKRRRRCPEALLKVPFWRIRSVRPSTAMRHKPPVHRTNLEGVLRSKRVERIDSWR
jgi:hypothetical protein